MGQSLSKVYLHIIFSTKDRMPLIDDVIEPELFRYMAGIGRDEGGHPLLINGNVDHVHGLFELGREVTISQLVKHIKAGSSKWIKLQGDKYQNFAWQTGYAVFSVGQSQLEIAKNYISQQKIHHQKIDYQQELREFLRKYQVEFDEKYVWG